MATEPKTLIIGDTTYIVGLCKATEGLRAGAALLRAAGPGLAGLRGGFMFAAASLVKDPALADVVEFLAETFRKYTTVRNAAAPAGLPLDLIYDDHFKGNYGALLKWLSCAVDVNLSSFLDELLVLFEQAQTIMVERAEALKPKA